MPEKRNAHSLGSWISDWIGVNGCDRSQLLPLLHALQEEIGFIDDEAIPLIASGLNLTRADVHGVISFYHDFRRQPAGRHVIKLCAAESCQARGGAAVAKMAEQVFALKMGETRADGRITLEPVYCLGLCAIGPSALIDGRPVAHLDAAKMEQISVRVEA